jgi:hypothetical protein
MPGPANADRAVAGAARAAVTGTGRRSGVHCATTPHAWRAPQPTLPRVPPQLGLNYSDKSGMVSVDVERGDYKMGYDLQRKVRALGVRSRRRRGGWGRAPARAQFGSSASPQLKSAAARALRADPKAPRGRSGGVPTGAGMQQHHGHGPPAPTAPGAAADPVSRRRPPQDLALQYKRKIQSGSITFKQVVPNLQWSLVPTPVVEVSVSGRAPAAPSSTCQRSARLREHTRVPHPLPPLAARGLPSLVAQPPLCVATQRRAQGALQQQSAVCWCVPPPHATIPPPPPVPAAQHQAAGRRQAEGQAEAGVRLPEQAG